MNTEDRALSLSLLLFTLQYSRPLYHLHFPYKLLDISTRVIRSGRANKNNTVKSARYLFRLYLCCLVRNVRKRTERKVAKHRLRFIGFVSEIIISLGVFMSTLRCKFPPLAFSSLSLISPAARWR